MNNDDEQDALFEALTINRALRPPERPRTYCNGVLWDTWFGPSGDKYPQDILYYKLETDVHTTKMRLHRIYGPAYISKKYDVEAWFKEGELHRSNGPAYRHKGSTFWYLNGKLHRLDGPAVDQQGHPKEYWIGGQKLSPKEYKKEIDRRKRKGLIK